MALVSIGPHLVKNGSKGLESSDLEHTGYSIEASSDEFALTARLYRLIYTWQRDKIQFSDFCVRVDEIPFKLLPTARIKEHSSMGKFVSLELVLGSLCINHEVWRSLTSFLREFRDHLPINHCYYPRIPNGSQMVGPALAKLGFEVIKFHSYGRKLAVQFGWVFPQDRPNADAELNLHAGTIEYKPKPDRALGLGQWQFPRETSVAYLFSDMLESMDQANLLSDLGAGAALDSFKWTRVSTLSASEAKQARLDFVKQHPELHHNHQALAEELKSAELYSDAAEVYAIKKQVPRLIRLATAK